MTVQDRFPARVQRERLVLNASIVYNRTMTIVIYLDATVDL